MNTKQDIERAIDNARTITENGYNLDRLVEFISFKDSPKSIAQRILTANFKFIDLLTSAENTYLADFNDSFFVLREVFEVFNEMEEEANKGVVTVVPKTEIQQHDELQTTKDNNANEEIQGLTIKYNAVWDLYEGGKAEITALNKLIASKNELVNELQKYIEFLKSELSDRPIAN